MMDDYDPKQIICDIDINSKCRHDTFRATLLCWFQSENPDCMVTKRLEDIWEECKPDDYMFRIQVLHKFELLTPDQYLHDIVMLWGKLKEAEEKLKKPQDDCEYGRRVF